MKTRGEKKLKAEQVKKYKDKKVKVHLKSKLFYTGVILEVEEDYLVMLDKFGGCVTINLPDISVLTERKEVNEFEG